MEYKIKFLAKSIGASRHSMLMTVREGKGKGGRGKSGSIEKIKSHDELRIT
jgi:hypothetical protein